MRTKLLLSSLLTILFLALIISGAALASNAGGSADMLAYTLPGDDGKRSLMLYDPQRGVTTLLFTGVTFRDFSFSIQGQIAFSLLNEGTDDIYLLDALSQDSSPINIIQNPTANDYPLSWSPDGRYLAFRSYQDDENHLIYVWDGESAINITPDNMVTPAAQYRTSWSYDGRLTFTVWYGFTGDSPRSEIYLWDGSTSVSLSQNPTDEDREPVWNVDGRVAFLWGSGDIFVWDGISTRDGLPDRTTFTNIAPELTDYMSFPIWTNDGLLAFEASDTQDNGLYQIYLWDGRTATNISQNPSLHNGSPRWSADGRWAFVTFFSSQQLLYVRDADNHTLLTVEGQHTPAWSSSGYLMFCAETSTGGLSIWDGQQIIQTVHSWEIWAQWQGGGEMVVCTNG